MDPQFLSHQLRLLVTGEAEPDAVVAAVEEQIAQSCDAFTGAVERCYFANWLYEIGLVDLALWQLERSESFLTGHPDPHASRALALVLALQSRCHAIVDPHEALHTARGAVQHLCGDGSGAAPLRTGTEQVRALRGTLGGDEPLLCLVCARHALALLLQFAPGQAAEREAQRWMAVAAECLPEEGDASTLAILAMGECMEATLYMMVRQLAAWDEGDALPDDEEAMELMEVLFHRLSPIMQTRAEHADPVSLVYEMLLRPDRRIDAHMQRRLVKLLHRLDPARDLVEVGGCFLLLGESATKGGDLKNATQLLRSAWGFLEAGLQPGHAWRLNALLQLGKLFEQTGDRENAASWTITAIGEVTFTAGLPAASALIGRLADLWESSNLCASLFLKKLSLLGAEEYLGLSRKRHWLVAEIFNPDGMEWGLARALIRAGRLAEAHEVLAWGDRRATVRTMSLRGKTNPIATDRILTPLESLQAERLRELAGTAEGDFDEYVRRSETVILSVADAFDRAEERYGAQASHPGREAGEQQVDMLPDAPGTTAVLRYLVLSDHLDVLLLTPSGTLHVEVPTSEAQINERAFEFLAASRKPSFEPTGLPLNDDLLPRALLDRLERENISRLAIGAMGALRFIPFAALDDGKRYLVERFPIVLLPEALIDLKTRPVWPSRVALTGASFAFGNAPLPGVGRELSGIRRILESGDRHTEVLDRRDDAFDRAAVSLALSGAYPVVHVASHFRLISADAPRSVLSLGQGDAMSLEEIERSAGDLRNVDLVVLSACSTGVPGAPFDAAGWSSPPSLLHARGVRSLVSTLWSVSDDSMSKLVRRFYEGMFGPDPLDKAQALQRAQLEILSSASTSHPFYWAGLKLSGNWMPFPSAPAA